MKIQNKSLIILYGFASIQLVLYSTLLFQSLHFNNNFHRLPFMLLLITCIFIFYFASFFLKKESHHTLYLILISAFIFRIICLFMPPLLSDDIYYYIWHGKVSAHGFNPYLYTPQSEALAFLRDTSIWNYIPFKDLAPAYPPWVMMMFHLAYKMGGTSLVAFKSLQLIPEALTIFFGIRLLKLKNKSPGLILIYAWCPLPIIEYLGMGHSDTWGIAFLMLFLYFFETQKIFRGFVFLALATLVKWIPLLFIPFLFRSLSNKKRAIALSSFLLTLLLCYLPYLSAGKNVFGMLPTYLRSWEFNASIYRFIRLGIEQADHTHYVISALIALWALIVALRKPPLYEGLLSITFFFFLFFHTVYPWYLPWMLPFLLFVSCWAAYAWIFTSFFSYWILISYRTQGVWQENGMTLFLEYLPVFLLLIIQWIYKQKVETPENK